MREHLLKDLRNCRKDDCGNDVICAEAADEIERLRAALRPLAAAEGKHVSCQCDHCGREIKMDTLVDRDLWKKISPTGDEGGLLCSSCIVDRVADLTVGERRWAAARLIPAHT